MVEIFGEYCLKKLNDVNCQRLIHMHAICHDFPRMLDSPYIVSGILIESVGMDSLSLLMVIGDPNNYT